MANTVSGHGSVLRAWGLGLEASRSESEAIAVSCCLSVGHILKVSGFAEQAGQPCGNCREEFRPALNQITLQDPKP